MHTFTRFSLAGAAVLALFACRFTGSPGALMLVKTANPQAYSQAGQTITYTYVITNMGTSALGLTQFTISDDKLGAPFHCGASDTTLAPQQSVACSAAYIITQADLDRGSITNTATASGGGQTSGPASITIINNRASATPTTIASPGASASPTPFGGTPNPTAGAAIRITVLPGQTTAVVNGVINPNETISYVLSAEQGQVLSITLTAPVDALAIGVNGPTGAVLKALDTSPTWSTMIPAAGDHLLKLMNVVGNSSVSYTLLVSLTTASIPASATSQP